MSFEALRWAHSLIPKLDQITSTQKTVLTALANRANEKQQCWPSIPRICKDTGYTDSATRKALIELEKNKFINRLVEKGKGTIYQLPIEQINNFLETPSILNNPRFLVAGSIPNKNNHPRSLEADTPPSGGAPPACTNRTPRLQEAVNQSLINQETNHQSSCKKNDDFLITDKNIQLAVENGVTLEIQIEKYKADCLKRGLKPRSQGLSNWLKSPYCSDAKPDYAKSNPELAPSEAEKIKSQLLALANDINALIGLKERALKGRALFTEMEESELNEKYTLRSDLQAKLQKLKEVVK